MLLVSEHSGAEVGFQYGEPGGSIATQEPPQIGNAVPSVSGLEAPPSTQTYDLPPAAPLSRLEPYFVNLEQEKISIEPVEVAPTAAFPKPATRAEMKEAASLISRCFADIPVSVIPINEQNLEQGYRLKMELFFDRPWESSKEIPSIPQQLQALKGFTVLVQEGQDFYRKIESSFRVDLDVFPYANLLPEIQQRVLEGIFSYRPPLNGPWV